MTDKMNFHRHVLAAGILIYCLLVVLFFLPGMECFTGALIGPPEDNLSHFWDMWWAHKVFIEHKGSLDFSNYIFYPEGSSLLFQAYSFYNLFLSLILRAALAPVVIYNLLILSTFVLSGIGAFLLIRHVTDDPYASLAGSFIFAFNPSHFAHSLHHIELSSIQFIPLFVLYFIKTVQDNSRRNLFLACLFFFLNSACSFYYFILGIYFMGFSYVYLMWKRRRLILRDILLKIILITVLTTAIFSPWLIKMVQVGLGHPEIAKPGSLSTSVVDLLALVIPLPYHLLAKVDIIRQINSAFTSNNWEKTAYLGIVNIIILLFVYKGVIRQTSKYFLGLSAFLLLSMGTHLHVLGVQTHVPLPYELIKHIPLLSSMQNPSRAVVYVYLFWAIIIAVALKHLRQTCMFGKIRKQFIILPVIILMFFDYYSMNDLNTEICCPPAYQAIKSGQEKFGILNLPAYDYRFSALYMMHQTFHGIPIVQGYIARKIGISLWDHLEFSDINKQREQLTRNNVKYIVLHKIPVENKSRLEEGIAVYKKYYKPIYEDSLNIVFQVY